MRPLPPTLLVRSTRPTDHYPVNGNTFSVVDETETVEAKDISAEIRSTATNLVRKACFARRMDQRRGRVQESPFGIEALP